MGLGLRACCIGLLDSFALTYWTLYPRSNLTGVKRSWTSKDINEVLPEIITCVLVDAVYSESHHITADLCFKSFWLRVIVLKRNAYNSAFRLRYSNSIYKINNEFYHRSQFWGLILLLSTEHVTRWFRPKRLVARFSAATTQLTSNNSTWFPTSNTTPIRQGQSTFCCINSATVLRPSIAIPRSTRHEIVAHKLRRLRISSSAC